MAKVGRKPLLVPTTEWKIRVPVDLAAKADLLNLDPVRGTIAYGARSDLITRLLREYLESLAPPSPTRGLDTLGAGDEHTISGDINPGINLPENQHV